MQFLSYHSKVRLKAPRQVSKTPIHIKAEKNRQRRKQVVRHVGGILLWLPVGAITAILTFCAIVLAVLQERDVSLPAFLADPLYAQLQAALPNHSLEYDDASFGLSRGFNPRLGFSSLRIRNNSDQILLDLGAAEITIDAAALARGKFRPHNLLLSGGVFAVVRNADGSFDIGFNQEQNQRFAPDLGALLASIGPAFDGDAALAELRSLRLDQISLRYEDRKANAAWTFDGGVLEILNDSGNLNIRADLAVLTGSGDPTTIALSYDRPKSGQASVSADLDNAGAADLATQSPALAWLGAIDAPISGGLRVQLDGDQLGPLNATLRMGAGRAKLSPDLPDLPFAGAKTYFTYWRDQNKFDLSLFEVITEWGQVSAQGSAVLRDVSENGLPGEVLLQLQSERMNANPMGLLDDQAVIDRFDADIRIRTAPFAIDIGQLRLRQGDSTAQATGAMVWDGGQPSGQISGSLRHIEMAQVLALWPESFKPRSRDWFARNLTQGVLRQATGMLRFDENGQMTRVASFAFDSAEIRYLKNFPKMQDARGSGQILDNALDILLDAADIQADQGGIFKASNVHMKFPDVTIKNPPVSFHLAGRGTMTAALSLLNEEPLRILDRANRPVTIADGLVDLSGDLTLRLKPDLKLDDMTFQFLADLSNLRSDQLIPNREFTARAVKLVATQDELRIFGPGRLAGIDAQVEWRQPLKDIRNNPGQVFAEFQLTPAALDRFDIPLPAGMLGGEAPAQLAVSLPAGQPPRLTVTSKLQGARLAVPAVGWSKSAGSSADFRLEAQLTQPISVDRFSLSAPGLRAEGRIDLRADGGSLEAIRFSSLQIGDWFRGPATLIGRGRAAPAVRLNGGWLHLIRAPFSRGGTSGTDQSNAIPPIEGALQEVVLNEKVSIQNTVFSIDGAGGLSGQFEGQVNGGALIRGTIRPRGNSFVADVRGQNAGAILRDAGFLKNAGGGQMALSVWPAQGGIRADLSVNDMRLRDAPPIAALLSAISVVGILEQMDGQGLLFNDIRAKVLFKDGLLSISESSAAGPSLGLSLDGRIDVSNSAIQLQGVVSPFYLVNAVGSFLTRRGEGLIGISFTINGTNDNPRVLVNPLSILTPGMFREIFRRPPPKID